MADEHKKVLEIIVEATPHPWAKDMISYVEVVTLEDPEFPQHPDRIYSVTYDHGPHENRKGVLSPGNSVYVKDKMEFYVKDTGES